MTAKKQSYDRSATTGETLIDVAERLYAERGIDAVSMREISRCAGQKNSSALQYHFESKEALIEAILIRRMNALDYRRLEYLDDLESRGKLDDLRYLVAALVKPLAGDLQTAKRPSTGSCYIGFLSEVQRHPNYDLFTLGKKASSVGLSRLYRLINKQLAQLPEAVIRQRFAMAISQIVHGLAEFERISSRRRGSRRPFDLERAVANLIDMITGALVAPMSTDVAERVRRHGASIVSDLDHAPSPTGRRSTAGPVIRRQTTDPERPTSR